MVDSNVIITDCGENDLDDLDNDMPRDPYNDTPNLLVGDNILQQDNSEKQPIVWTTDLIFEKVSEIIIRTNDPLLRELKPNKLLYLDKLIGENQEFFDKFPQLFVKVAMGMTKDDIEQLGKFLAMTDMINEKKISKEKGEFILGKDLGNKYAPHLVDHNKQMPD
jgi:hypothetical protein